LTGLYYADYQGLKKLNAYPQPPKLKNVALVTFTDGLDNYSLSDSETNPENYGSKLAYRTALHNKIVNELIHGKSVAAYTIGLKGNDVDDEVEFHIVSIELIRKNDQYGGYRVKLNAVYDTINTPLSIDVSTGDIITPGAIQYEFSGLFNENEHITLLGYNIETVLAEKVETILSRGVFNTRPRDYYDIYILATTQNYSQEIFDMALSATATHRGSTKIISDRTAIVSRIAGSEVLQEMWMKYQNRFSYAKEIPFTVIIEALKNLLGLLS
jgi:hypothetical protein